MASPDYYQILGISRKAKAREVRDAYRALARKYHPDFNPGDETAIQKFREVEEAYEVLGNPQKRKAYDYYGPNFGQRIPTRNVQAAEPSNTPSVGTPSDFPRYAPRGNRPTDRFSRGGLSPLALATLGRAVFAVVLLGGAFLYFLWPNSGVSEFQRAQKALQHVKSWRMSSRSAGSDAAEAQYLDEVSCPSSERWTQHIRHVIAGRTIEFTLETIIIGNVRYMHTDQSKAWTRDWAGAAGPADTCAKLSRGEDAGQLPPLREWLTGWGHHIGKENLRETEDGKCREWKISTPGRFSGAPTMEFLCLGVKDHLPRFRGLPGGPEEVRFYDWNVPIGLQPPDLAASETREIPLQLPAKFNSENFDDLPEGGPTLRPLANLKFFFSLEHASDQESPQNR